MQGANLCILFIVYALLNDSVIIPGNKALDNRMINE